MLGEFVHYKYKIIFRIALSSQTNIKYNTLRRRFFLVYLRPWTAVGKRPLRFYSMSKLSYRAFRPFKILPGCRTFSHGSIQKNSRPVKKLSTHENKSRKININSQRVDLPIARCNDIWACYPKNGITKIIFAPFFWQRISFTKSEENFSDSDWINLGNAN